MPYLDKCLDYTAVVTTDRLTTSSNSIKKIIDVQRDIIPLFCHGMVAAAGDMMTFVAVGNDMTCCN